MGHHFENVLSLEEIGLYATMLNEDGANFATAEQLAALRNYEYTPGDVNFDDETDEIDVALVLKYISGTIDFTTAQIESADVHNSGDGADLPDVIEILNMAYEEDEE